MRFRIKHEIKGRLHIHVLQKHMSYREADTLYYYLISQKNITSAKVHERTQAAVICYEGSREEIIRLLKGFSYERTEVPESFLENSSRELNEKYKEKLIGKVVLRAGRKFLVPAPIRSAFIAMRAAKYIWRGARTLAKGKIEVPVLDATAIGVSMLRRDMKTASSVMFLLGIGEILEEWTHKKSVHDLASSMSLNVEKVWLRKDNQELLVPIKQIEPGDEIVVHMGNVIPFDGVVADGEAMVNQASMTGEPLPVRKGRESYVYAGTVVEEGELILKVKQTGGASRFEKIVTMIEESEKLKSSLESKAEHLADRLVPYTLLGTGLIWLLTRNVTRALSVLMVDFSCALKLAMPISVLSAIREANQYHITVKGGKYLEAMAEADTIVFDKTGTLTKAEPVVVDVISFNDKAPDELLRIAACLEEHFPHSMAKAVVDAAKQKNLVHEELHSKVEYIVAHGIATTIEGKRAIIGSYHFVFEDEQCVVPEGMLEQFAQVPAEYSCLYLAIEQQLAAVICIEDPLREEAAEVVAALKQAGIAKVVMMTGDSERTAHAIAGKVGVDEYYSEVLPEDKAKFVEQERAAGHKVIMIGDGINDSPALSAADVGIAISDGAAIAREIADVTIGADDLHEIVTLKAISDGLMKRIQKNYRVIVGFNAGLIAGGVAGVLQPTTSALLHNTSTLVISLESMKNLLN
ncbi:MAG: heavy metal translocating P-type ATPase [Lachnospiraceae bacterium]|nr:heavy metal translocating P-type ATPase [Lachnospiraceae bacterium]